MDSKKCCILRQLEGPNIEQLNVTDLAQLETQFNAALTYTRSRKVSFFFYSMKIINGYIM